MSLPGKTTTGGQKKRPWDATFAHWIAKARARGDDPNDFGDEEWSDPSWHINEYYLPRLTERSVVLELGPGTGRVSRHLIGRCRELILVDYSELVCRWLGEYLDGKGRFRIVCIDRPELTGVESDSVDMVIAFGVFEHVDVQETMWFLEEFHRVLVPGGIATFNFDNVMTDEGIQWLRRGRGAPATRYPFHAHHPEAMRRLAEAAGFDVLRLSTDSTRHADIEMQKPI